MKRLMKLKLINWHRFTNETIEFGGNSILLTGENGVGKSTILDAIQFVITVSKNNFNKAAHENGKRKLAGYVRCKTGKENKPYERTGQITAHVALEFYDEDRKAPFIVGAVVDSASEDKETAFWYQMENETIRDELFCQGNQIRNISMFRVYNGRALKTFTKTQSEARKIFKSRFGRLDDKFFELIPKSLAFKPINDIKDFVYSYVLDKRDVNIEILRDNVRTYQDFLMMLESIRIKLSKLEKINGKYDEVMSCIRKEKTYDYYLARAEKEITEADVKSEQSKIEEAKRVIGELMQVIARIKEQRNSKEARHMEISAELSGNEEFIALKNLEKEIDRLKGEIDQLMSEKKDFMESVKTAVKNARVLLDADNAKTLLPLNMREDCIREYVKIFSDIEGFEDIAGARQVLEQVVAYKTQMQDKIVTQLFHKTSQKDTLVEELKEIDIKIGNLEKKQLNYDSNVLKLKEAIEGGFLKLNRHSKPKILCELLEVTDEKWRNAVEGYLNMQRFYLLVEPESFDVALSIYNRMKEQEGMHGVGLINTAQLEKYELEPDNTLATVVTSKNTWAKRYINMVLGKVIMCEKPEELKKYNNSITPGCMRYKNNVAIAINPGVYEIPYIGAEACRVQLEHAKAIKKDRLTQISRIDTEISRMNQIKAGLSRDEDVDVKYRLHIIHDLRIKKQQQSEYLEDRKRLEQNSTFIEKQIELNKIKDEIIRLNNELDEKNKKQGSYEENIKTHRENILTYEERAVRLAEGLKLAQEALVEDLSICGQDYGKLIAQKNPYKLKEDYELTKKRNDTTKNNNLVQLTELMSEYKSAHDFGAEASMTGYKAFFEEYDKLKNSELLSYEQKVYDAKTAAEQEFREQFLSKLQENIKKAHGEFNDLNKALKNITFGNDKYRFEYSGSKKYQLYYKMIMDDFNIMQGESLFTGQFHESHKEVIEELFDKLTAEGENSTLILEEFTDYRTYMDYDIRIDHGDEGFSYYSKVCEEKSGGETQTPFYVTVAASFMQLYTGGIGGDAIGLIMFDEAFNNMDDERISGVLEFLSALPLQIIISAPPDKVQYIQPIIKNVSLVLQDNNISYVERFAHERI